MNIDYKTVKGILDESTPSCPATVEFTKTDGSTRVMKCTTNYDSLVESDEQQHAFEVKASQSVLKNHTLTEAEIKEAQKKKADRIKRGQLVVWDLEKMDYRSINVESITKISDQLVIISRK